MTLSDVLKEFGNKDWDAIEYRRNTTVESSDTDYLCGFATYKNKMLMSADGDSYHLSDNIVKYEKFKDNWLVVWI